MKSNPRRFTTRDANHAEIVEAYERLFCSVFEADTVGFGFPDLVVGISGVTCLVEIKTPDGVLEATQERFIQEWRGQKVVIVRTEEQVIAHVNSIRKRFGEGLA